MLSYLHFQTCTYSHSNIKFSMKNTRCLSKFPHSILYSDTISNGNIDAHLVKSGHTHTHTHTITHISYIFLSCREHAIVVYSYHYMFVVQKLTLQVILIGTSNVYIHIEYLNYLTKSVHPTESCLLVIPSIYKWSYRRTYISLGKIRFRTF